MAGLSKFKKGVFRGKRQQQSLKDQPRPIFIEANYFFERYSYNKENFFFLDEHIHDFEEWEKGKEEQERKPGTLSGTIMWSTRCFKEKQISLPEMSLLYEFWKHVGQNIAGLELKLDSFWCKSKRRWKTIFQGVEWLKGGFCVQPGR